MSLGYALLITLVVSGLAAALEGACAGKNVKPFFTSLTFPPYSASLWIWSIIGGLYYLIFSFVIFRLLRLDTSQLRSAALGLILFMMIANALTNYIIFRLRDLRLSFIVGCLFPVMDLTLLILLTQLDTVAAWSLVPYLVYRVYAVWWGYALWNLNRG
jgi:tryptophan-rich sensory protein